MEDENNNGIDDEIESHVYKAYAGRKFWLTVCTTIMMFIIAFILLFRNEFESMNDTLKLVIWIVGLYCGANVAKDFAHIRKEN